MPDPRKARRHDLFILPRLLKQALGMTVYSLYITALKCGDAFVATLLCMTYSLSL